MKEKKILKKSGRKLIAIIAMISLIALLPMSAYAHSGRTDSNGGHRDNQNKSGLGYYHYHCGGNPPHLHPNGYCPYNGPAPSSSSYSSSGGSSSRKVYATKIDVHDEQENFDVGDCKELEVSVYPLNAEDDSITWESKNPDIVSISPTGYLEALDVGTAVIVASTSRGTTKSITIRVNEVVAVDMKISDKLDTIDIGDIEFLYVDFEPENTTNQDVKWISDNPSVVEMNESQLIAKSIGVATITAKHGKLKDSFTIEVIPIEAESVEIKVPPVSDVFSNDRNGYSLKSNNSIQFEANIFPYDTTDKTIKWSVDNEDIAAINEDGILEANRYKNGAVIVTAETANGITAEIEINIHSNIATYLIIILSIIVLIGGTVIFITRNFKQKKRNSISEEN